MSSSLETFPVHQIDPEWVLEPEQLGTKNKFWFRADDAAESELFQGSEWLFKYPTAGTGQHWAEKIAYEIAQKMKVNAPRVELVEMEGERGSACINFCEQSATLYHGNQLIAARYSDYELNKKQKQNKHTVGRIFESIQALFKDEDAGKKACLEMAGYLLLDALIGNVDRHHENWGVLRKEAGERLLAQFAPSYDHASSLGRELNDEGGKQSRSRYLNELGVEKFIYRGRGAIYLNETESHGPSPLSLVERCLENEELAHFFRPNLSNLLLLQEDDFHGIVSRVPEQWMSPIARIFVTKFLSYSYAHLLKLHSSYE